MANSTNTLWLVGCSIWHNAKNGMPCVDHCNARAYRLEKNARARYSAVVDSLRQQGYVIQALTVPENEEYEGVQCHKSRNPERDIPAKNAVVFIDRNPVWTPD